MSDDQKNTTHRINVNFTGDAYRTLTDLAKAKGKSKSEVLRDALTLEKWVEEARQEGARIFVDYKGNIREVLIR